MENNYESRIDTTYREPKRCVKEGWILLPGMQGRANRTAMSEEMDGYASKEGGKGEIYRTVWEEEIERRKANGERRRGTDNLRAITRSRRRTKKPAYNAG